jgi:membrane protease YdiL (CAAX protease family)
MDARTPGARSDETRSIAGSLLLMTSIWLVVGGAQVSGWGAGEDGRLAVGFSAAALATIAARPPSSVRIRPFPIALGLASGFASYFAWIPTIAWIGTALGLPPSTPASRSNAGSWLLWLCATGLGPVFEELLYRERLLGALRSRLGPSAAILLSSALFAVSHVTPWSVLGTFCVGLFLGIAYTRSRSIGLCIALHSGVNASCLAFGLPASTSPLVPIGAGLLAWVLFVVGLAVARESDDSAWALAPGGTVRG